MILTELFQDKILAVKELKKQLKFENSWYINIIKNHFWL
jgi:hypothetical protein